MASVSLDRLCDLDLFDIYLDERQRDPLVSHPSLTGPQSVALALGRRFADELERRLLIVIGAGHRCVHLEIHPQLVRLIAAADLNRQRLEAGEAWQEPPAPHPEMPVCELDLHQAVPQTGQWSNGPLHETGARHRAVLRRALLDRVRQGINRFQIVLPRAMASAINAHQHRDPALDGSCGG